MTVSLQISKYIENSKLNGRICRWNKQVIYVYITTISAPVANKDFYYFQVNKGMENWNIALKTCGINLRFDIANTPDYADVVVHWTKVGRVFEGMCKYPGIVNGEFKKISIDDVMYVPHQKNISTPGPNDLYVLKYIYSN